MITDTHCLIMLTFEMIWSARQDSDNQAELYSLSAPSVLNQIPEILSSVTEKWIGSLKWKYISLDDESHEGVFRVGASPSHYALHHVVLSNNIVLTILTTTAFNTCHCTLHSVTNWSNKLNQNSHGLSLTPLKFCDHHQLLNTMSHPGVLKYQCHRGWSPLCQLLDTTSTVPSPE